MITGLMEVDLPKADCKIQSLQSLKDINRNKGKSPVHFIMHKYGRSGKYPCVIKAVETRVLMSIIKAVVLILKGNKWKSPVHLIMHR